MNARTSIITLTYNRPQYLFEAIKSIEKQTDPDWEHLVLNNGSTDKDVLRVLSIAKENNPEKFRVLHQSPMLDMVGVNWNILLKLTRGKYITILDDDNRKRTNFLEKTVSLLEADPTIDAVTCGWQPIDDWGLYKEDALHLNLKTSMPNLYKDNTIDSNAITFRRSVLDKIGVFDPTLTTNEDWHFIIRLVRNCKIIHLPDVLLDYRIHETSRSKRAIALGAHDNWHKIRTELFTPDEILSYKWR